MSKRKDTNITVGIQKKKHRIYAIFVMIGGVAFFATITGTITEVISSNSRSTARFQVFFFFSFPQVSLSMKIDLSKRRI